MLTFAPRMDQIKPSATVQVANTVRDMKAQGVDVISLSIGVPGFLPPAHVYDAAREELKNDKGNYFPGKGSPALIDAFLQRMQADGFNYKASEVCATAGGKNALYLLLQVLVGEGDEVLYPSPFWTSYPDIVKLAGATPTHIDCPASQDYKLTPEQLDAAITPQTKVFIFNNPNNPTGMVYSEEEIRALGDVLVKHPDIWILSDDIYDKLVYDKKSFHHLLHTHPELRERTAIMQSISKTYGMPGWRVGMVAAPGRLIQALVKLVGQSLMNVTGVAMAGAAAAFAGDHTFLTPIKQNLTRNRDLTLETLGQFDDVSCPFPSGAFYAFPDIGKLLGKTTAKGQVLRNDLDFSTALLEEQQVATVPGSAFGHAQAVRFSYACDEAVLQAGMERLTQFIKGLK